MQTEPKDVLDYWFGDETDDIAVSKSQSGLWWAKNEDADKEIRRRFLPVVQASVNGELSGWGHDPHALLAQIILVDQFNRNIWRNDRRAFADDPKAREWASQLIAGSGDLALRSIERVFAYLPFQHSESIDDQGRCVALYEQLRDAQQGQMRKMCHGYLDYAHAHHRIIARFGRFPHRNSTLGRESTDEELEFLSQPGSSY